MRPFSVSLNKDMKFVAKLNKYQSLKKALYHASHQSVSACEASTALEHVLLLQAHCRCEIGGVLRAVQSLS